MADLIQDYIVSGSRNERYVRIEYAHSRELEDYCHGKVLEQRFPDRLAWLLNEYEQLVQHFVVTLMDDVEEEIQTYDLHLESTGQRIYTIMLLEDQISFFLLPAFDEEDARWNEESLDDKIDSSEKS